MMRLLFRICVLDLSFPSVSLSCCICLNILRMCYGVWRPSLNILSPLRMDRSFKDSVFVCQTAWLGEMHAPLILSCCYKWLAALVQSLHKVFFFLPHKYVMRIKEINERNLCFFSKPWIKSQSNWIKGKRRTKGFVSYRNGQIHKLKEWSQAQQLELSWPKSRVLIFSRRHEWAGKALWGF